MYAYFLFCLRKVALLLDTAKFLGNLQGATPSILVTTSSSQSDRLITSSIPWITDRMSISTMGENTSADNQDNELVGDEDVLVKNLEVHCSETTTPSSSPTTGMDTASGAVKFAISRTKRDQMVIRWKSSTIQMNE